MPDLKQQSFFAGAAFFTAVVLLVARAATPFRAVEQEMNQFSELKGSCCFKADETASGLLRQSEYCSEPAGDSCFTAVYEDGIQFIRTSRCEADTALPCLACGLPGVWCF